MGGGDSKDNLQQRMKPSQLMEGGETASAKSP